MGNKYVNIKKLRDKKGNRQVSVQNMHCTTCVAEH